VQRVTENVIGVRRRGGHGGPPLQYVRQSTRCLVVTCAVVRTVGAALRGRPCVELLMFVVLIEEDREVPSHVGFVEGVFVTCKPPRRHTIGGLD